MHLLGRMLKEEWRTHSRLFGSYGFAAFPLLIILMTGITYPVLFLSGFSLNEILLGVNALVFFFGLNVGTIGFISRDALKNLLGEQNLLIFSSRTLPISQKRIIVTFLIKDLLYYSAFFIVPILIGLLPAYYYTGAALTGIIVMGITGILMFMLGVAISFLLAILYVQNRFMAAGLGIGALLLTAVFPGEILVLTPIVLLSRPSIATVLTATVPIVLLIGFGIALYRDTEQARSRTRNQHYDRLSSKLAVLNSPIAIKSILDIMRSSGSLFKLVFSQAVVFSVFAYFLLSIPFMDVFAANAITALATVLGLGSITTYSWLNRFDRGDNYRRLPLTTEDVFKGKIAAFYLLALPIGYLFLVLTGVLFDFSDILLGAITYPLIATYMVGLISFLAGTEPDTLMFDVRRFAAFSILSGIVIVPLFVALLLIQDAIVLSVFVLTLSAVAAGIGHTMYEAAPHHWDGR